MTRLLPLFIFLLSFVSAFSQTAMTNYYTFDEVNPLAPTVGSGNINPFSSAYSIGNTSGIVGKYMTEPPFTDHVESNWPIPTSSFTWMGWVRPGYKFNLARNATLFNFCNMSASIQYPYMKFTTSTKPAGTAFSDEFFIYFYGVNKASWHNLFDGSWHHLTFVFNATTGTKQVWIDGQLPSGFSKSIATGNINAGSTTVNYWADFNGILNRYAGDIDEVAVWINTAVGGPQIYSNYTVSLAGGHYTTANISPVPAPQPITSSLDTMDFMPGTVLPTPTGQQTSGVTVSAIDQLRAFPLGRYRYFSTASDSFPPIFSFYDPEYLGGKLQPGVTSAQWIQNAVDIGLELSLKHNWEYQLWQVGEGTVTGATTYIGKSFAAKKANLRIKLGVVTFRRQQSPYDAIPCDNSQPPYPIQFYLHNAASQKLDANGNVSGNGRPCPSWTYAQSLLACPDTVMYWMGDSIYKAFRRLQTAYGADSANFNIFHVIENGEDESRLLDPAMNGDPRVPAWVAAAGTSNIMFQSTARMRRSLAYSNKFQGTLQCTDSMLYAEYQDQGNPSYFSLFDTTRYAFTPWQGKYYMSTSDLYLRNANEWLYGNYGAFHGLRWFMDNQPIELIRNKQVANSPFTSNGYDINEGKNVRPAEYLGILKLMGAMGAITYYASVFNLSDQVSGNPDPKNIIGGCNMVEYAQALTTRYRETLFHGLLMQGDMPQVLDSANSGTRAFNFNAGYGKYADYVVVRKDSASTSYVIAGCINPNTNDRGGVPVQDTCVITLASQLVKFVVRKQGSVYRYDNSVSPPIFYQYDGWHESSHPYRWTRDFYFHTANRDNATRPPLKTYVPAGTAAGDYRSFLTALSYADTATVFAANNYYFFPRPLVDTLFLWMRCRVRTLGQTTGCVTTIDGSSSFTIAGITDTNWFWYRRQGQTIISYPNVDTVLHYFSFQASNKYLEVEQILLTYDGSLILPNNEGGCGTVIANISPSSGSVCSGSSTSFTANSNSSYLWSTGATTQAVSVSSAATYTVTVFDSFGCTGTATAVLSVNANPSTPAITVIGSTTFCSGSSVTLQGPGGATSYLWSTGAISQSILAIATGSYRVTVSNAAGCTASSNATSVTVNLNPILASIPPVANTCPATTFDLSTITLTNTGAAGTSSYYATQANAIAGTSPISSTVSATGTYWIRVTTVAGCFDYKSVGVVISNCSCVSPPTANAGPDQSICAGSTATMAGSVGGSATIGTWSTSGTGTFGSTTVLNTVYTPSVADRAAGSVTITLTTNNPSGAPCAVATNQMILTINALPTAVIVAGGSTTFCTGGSVNLVATIGNSYAWSNGATTQSTSITTSGSYSCTVTGPTGCTAVSNTIAVTVNTAPSTPTITASGAVSFCDGDSVTLSSSTGTTYIWTTGATTTSIVVYDAGSYVVTITNAATCTAASGATAVTVLPTPNIPTITASKSPILCTGDSVTLTSSRISSNLWSTGAVSQSITVHDAGTYTVTVTNALGCSKVSSSVTVSYINCDVTCRVPTRLTVGRITTTRATLGWDSLNVATDYEIWLTNIRTNTVQKIVVQGTYHKWTLKNLWPATGYSWVVRAWCGTNVYTAFSVRKYFTTR